MHIVASTFGSASQSPKKEENLAKTETAMGGAICCYGTAK